MFSPRKLNEATLSGILECRNAAKQRQNMLDPDVLNEATFSGMLDADMPEQNPSKLNEANLSGMLNPVSIPEKHAGRVTL